MKTNLEIRPVLFISTAHLSDPHVADDFAHPLEYGWLYYCHGAESDPNTPECLRECAAFALSRGAEYIRFDADADEVDGLATYDW